MLEFTSPVPMEKLKEKIEEGYFDEEVLIHFINALKGSDKEKLLNGEIKPYDLIELDIMIRDMGWKQVYINSSDYSYMDEETLKVAKKRIDMLFDKAKKECEIENITEEMTIDEVIEQLEDLRKDRESFITNDPYEVYKKDIQAIDYALKVLKESRHNE